ncbi:sodium- and chloride-dependent GABA transporter 1-like [Sarcoptes scabiei]|nr:sodium- and chloride-dependent GABA transporter 1-like [Sarcoptes scabiei]
MGWNRSRINLKNINGNFIRDAQKKIKIYFPSKKDIGFSIAIVFAFSIRCRQNYCRMKFLLRDVEIEIRFSYSYENNRIIAAKYSMKEKKTIVASNNSIIRLLCFAMIISLSFKCPFKLCCLLSLSLFFFF